MSVFVGIKIGNPLSTGKQDTLSGTNVGKNKYSIIWMNGVMPLPAAVLQVLEETAEGIWEVNSYMI